MKKLIYPLTLCTILIFYLNCTENDQLIQPKEASNFKTVSIQNALQFIQTTQNNLQNRNNENYIQEIYSEFLLQEEISNSNELVTTIPVRTSDNNVFSRIVLLEIDGSIQSVIVSYLPDFEINSEKFSGEFIITDIDGNFIDGYKVENGLYIIRYTGNRTWQNQSTSSLSRTTECEFCVMTICSLCELDEVVVESTTPQGPTPYIPVAIMYPLDLNEGGTNCEVDCGNNWNGLPGNSSGPGNGASVIIDEPEDPINDLDDFFECFDTNQNASLTIYALEPNPGTGDTHNGTFVGHAYVSITQGNNISTFGYYPVSNWISPINTSSTAILGNDGGDQFSASYTTNLNPGQLQDILNAIQNFNPTYDLDDYNCTDFVIDMANLAGLGFPECNGSWPGGSGSNPGTLGIEIRNRNNSDGNPTNAGNSPNSNKDC